MTLFMISHVFFRIPRPPHFPSPPDRTSRPVCVGLSGPILGQYLARDVGPNTCPGIYTKSFHGVHLPEGF